MKSFCQANASESSTSRYLACLKNSATHGEGTKYHLRVTTFDAYNDMRPRVFLRQERLQFRTGLPHSFFCSSPHQKVGGRHAVRYDIDSLARARRDLKKTPCSISIRRSWLHIVIPRMCLHQPTIISPPKVPSELSA